MISIWQQILKRMNIDKLDNYSKYSCKYTIIIVNIIIVDKYSNTYHRTIKMWRNDILLIIKNSAA